MRQNINSDHFNREYPVPRALTTEVVLSTNRQTYTFAQIERLRNKRVIGLRVRTRDAGGNGLTITGNSLAVDQVIAQAFLTLDVKSELVHERIPLSFYTTDGITGDYIAINLPGFDPSQSRVELASSTGVVNGHAIEFTWIYMDDTKDPV